MEIGGDITGLQTLGRTLTGVAPDVRDSTDYLFKRVDDLVGDAGWNGDAADTFSGAWEQDGTAVQDLADILTLAGQAITELADALQGAQTQLDGYVASAARAGVAFTDTGPLPGPYTEPALSAAKTFQTDSRQAFSTADAARQKAAGTLHTLLATINPQVPSQFKGTNVVDLAVLGALIKGYYVLPAQDAEKMRTHLAKVNADYRAAMADADTDKLSERLKSMRVGRAALMADLDRAESFSDKFKGGELLDASIADTFRGLGGGLEEDSKLGRALDGLPVVDVALAGLATWAQATDDHEKGWSWTHALIADGGANVEALGAGLASDYIPFVGPILAPAVGYGVGAFWTEATHEGHWTEHIMKDGPTVGLAEGVADTVKATYHNDVDGMRKKVEYDVFHPVNTVKGVWNGVTNLF